MKRVLSTLVLLVLFLVLATTAQAGPVVEPNVCAVEMTSIPWGGVDPTSQPAERGWPFYCCRCRVCMNIITMNVYEVCNCGYFDGCGSGYPSCNQPPSITLYKTCDCP